MAKCAAAAGTGTVAVIMLPDQGEYGPGIDCSTVVLVPWRFVTVMMMANAGMRGNGEVGPDEDAVQTFASTFCGLNAQTPEPDATPSR